MLTNLHNSRASDIYRRPMHIVVARGVQKQVPGVLLNKICSRGVILIVFARGGSNPAVIYIWVYIYQQTGSGGTNLRGSILIVTSLVRKVCLATRKQSCKTKCGAENLCNYNYEVITILL